MSWLIKCKGNQNDLNKRVSFTQGQKFFMAPKRIGVPIEILFDLQSCCRIDSCCLICLEAYREKRDKKRSCGNEKKYKEIDLYPVCKFRQQLLNNIPGNGNRNDYRNNNQYNKFPRESINYRNRTGAHNLSDPDFICPAFS